MLLEQSAMTPSRKPVELNDMAFGAFRGKILEGGIHYQDQNEAKQTLVDVFMYDLLPDQFGVPLMCQKINRVNGESTDPEGGDLVVVSFLGGNVRDPVVLGFLPSAANGIQSLTADAPRSGRTMNGTSETIGKDGSRTIFVAKDDNVTITGSGTVTVAGDLTFNVTKGDLEINVEVGDVSLTSGGMTTIQGVGGVQILGDTEGEPLGVVTGSCLCVYTGQPHPDVSMTVMASS